MMDRARADAAAALFNIAVEQAGGVKDGCLALIAAAAAGQHLLRGIMAEAKVDDIVAVLSIAGAVLADDECDGLLNLAQPAGSA